MPELTGYSGRALSLLSDHSISVGDTVSVKTSDEEYSGILMPRYEFADDNHIVIKLKSGYNIGIEIGKIARIEKMESKSEHMPAKKTQNVVDRSLPRIALISTGGTIASKIDYRTGGVKAALTAEELYSAVPELSKYAKIEAEVLFSEYSENLTAKHWSEMAKKVNEKVVDSCRGVILTHGTDTMHYSAAALSFALTDVPVPVVLVGAQRSSDRPSSDAALNLIGATIFATRAQVSGVYVAMHAGMSDNVIAVHVGTRVRKNHTSRRDAFESINMQPAALIDGERMEMKLDFLPKRNNGKFYAKPDFEERVALIKYHPSMDPRLIENLVVLGYRGIVFEGTGLGHVGKQYFESIKKAIRNNMLVCMTSQCIWGRVRMTVYETGRDLLSIGVIPLSDMTAETALVKMMWALANSKNVQEAKDIMLKNVAFEYYDTTPFE
jgi:glutamyl-tRNA(Gln) amidotransferase subunit D